MKPTSWRASGVLLLLLSLPALAATDAIELQLPASNVLPLVLDRARASIGCFPQFQVSGTDFLVDHVTFPSPATLQRSAAATPVTINPSLTFLGHPLQVVVPAQVFLKPVATANDPSVPQSGGMIAQSVSLFLDLSASSSGGVDQLCATPSAIEPALPGVLAAIQSQVGTPCFPMKLGGLDAVLDGKATRTAVGVSANAALDTLAIRLEFDHPTPDLATWKAFIDQGALSAAPANLGFAAIFDEGLLSRVMKKRFEENLTDPAMTVESPGLSASFPLPGVPDLHIGFDAQLSVPICVNTIGAHPVSIDMFFGLSPGGDAVTVNGSVDWDLVDSDVFLCGLLLGGGDPAVIAAVAIVAGQLGGIPGKSLPTQCQKIDDKSFSCAFPVSLPSLEAGGASLQHTELAATSLTSFAGGLVIGGTSTLLGTPTAPPQVTIDDTDIAYGIYGGCNSLHIGTEGTFSASGKGTVCNAPMAIAGDLLGVFGISGLSGLTSAPWSRTVKFGEYLSAAQLQSYFAQPYAAKVTVLTSGGTRTVALGPAVAPSAQEQFATGIGLVAAKASCMKLETGWFGIPGKFDPHWLVDPPIDLVAVVHLASGVNTTARVTLSNIAVTSVGLSARRTAAFSIPNQTMRMDATATINFGRLGTYTVPVSGSFRGTLSGKDLGSTGLVQASMSRGATAGFSVVSRSLPASVSSVVFSVDASGGNMGLQGVLPLR